VRRNHVLITGTGRAGTTFLVHLLTKVGIHTGFDPDNIESFIDEKSFGGLEVGIRNRDAPYVIKSPELSLELDEILQDEEITIDAVIVPFRPIKQVVASRLEVQSKSGDFFPNSVPGGITTGGGGTDQEHEMYLRIEQMLFSLSQTHIPVIFLAFPLLMHDKEYLHRKLVSVFPSIQYEIFSEAFDSIYVPERVHEFGSEAVSNLQGQETTWNSNFVNKMIENHIEFTEKINQLETINQQLRNELNQAAQTDKPT
jgi:hypothetical protein